MFTYTYNNGVSVEVFFLYNYCNFKCYRELCHRDAWVEKNWRTLCNTAFFTPSVQMIFFIVLQHDVWKHSRYLWSLSLSFQFSAPIKAILIINILTLILPRSRTGTVWFYTSTSNKRAAWPKLYTKSLTRDLQRMYSRFTLVRISIKL